MKVSDAKDLLIIAVVGGVAIWIYNNLDLFKKKVGDAFDSLKKGLDPTADTNIFYQGANSLTRAVTGTDETLGTWAYNLINGNEYDAYVYSPYQKADGTRGMRVTQVIRRSDGRVFRVVDGLLGPQLQPVSA